jgi:hypothetical protein
MSAQRAVFAVVIAILVAGCNGTSVREEYGDDGKTVKAREFKGANPDYAVYTQAWERAVTASATPAQVDLSACTDDRCRENIHAQAMIAKAAGGGQQMPALAPPAPKPSFWRELTGGLKDLAQGSTPLVLGLDAGKTARHSSDNAVEMERVRTDGTLGAFGYFAAQNQASAEALRDLGIAGAESAGDRINVGDGSVYAPGAGVAQIGNSAGRDMLGEGANSGTQTTTTTTTNTTVENGAIVERSQDVQIEQGEGDQRVESPGPYTDDHSNDGDDCADNSCNPPADPPPPGR